MYFKIYAGFEGDNEIAISSKGKKTSIFKQNPVSNSSYIVSELVDVLKMVILELIQVRILQIGSWMRF